MNRRLRLSTPVTMGMFVALFVAILWPNPSAFAQLSNTPIEETWETNGVVHAIATTSTTTYIGGEFTYVGPHTGSGVPMYMTAGAPAGPFPKVNGEVDACISDGSDGWYIGGEFTQVGSLACLNIAHILAGGIEDPAWTPNADGRVRSLAIAGSTVYAGGAFMNIGGQNRDHIAALYASGQTGQGDAIPIWTPNADGDVYALAVTGVTVYAGGAFANIGGQPRGNIAALDALNQGNGHGNAISSWIAHADGDVRCLALSGTSVYAGGLFSIIGGQTRKYIAHILANGVVDTAWIPDADNYVYALAVSGGMVYAGGAFTTFGVSGPTRNHIAALDAGDGSVSTVWDPNADGDVKSLAVSFDGTTVYAGGLFSIIGGQTRHCIAALDASGQGNGQGNAIPFWNPGANNVVSSLAVSNTMAYAGGSFSSIGGLTRNYIAALDANGQATAWDPSAEGADASVLALAVSGGIVYAGGGVHEDRRAEP